MKTCKRCNDLKCKSEFNDDKRTKDGLSYWCRSCYRIYNRERQTGVSVVNKCCSRCKKTKLSSDFYLRRSGRQSGRLMSQCIDCLRIIQKDRGYTRQMKSVVLERKYGVTIEQFDSMMWSQDGKCAICERQLTEDTGKGKTTTACVDHCHETGEIRGLLCGNCNRALGLFQDNIDIMKKAQKHITRSACSSLLEEVI